MKPSDVEITSPCPVDFGDFVDPEAKRSFCSHCDKHVHNLSAMTEREATRLVEHHDATPSDDGMCVTYTPTTTGGIRFRPSRRQMLRAAVAGLVIGLAPAVAQASGAPDPDGGSVVQALRDWWNGPESAEDESTHDIPDTQTEPELIPEVQPPPKPAGGIGPRPKEPEALTEPKPRPVEPVAIAGGIRPSPPPTKRGGIRRVEPRPLPTVHETGGSK